MQLDEKLVEGREAAQIESQQREQVDARGEEQLPAPIVEAMRDADVERRNQLLGAMRMILDRQNLTVAQLRLPQRESLALEALQAATTGRTTDLGQFIYAEDRRDLLEQALTVLQPDAMHVNDAAALELQAQLDDIGEKVATLRETIANLEDAQDEVLEDAQKQALASQADPADKPKPKPSDPDAPRPPTTLTGPALPEPAPQPSTLDGPALPEPAPQPSTLDGPALPEPASLPSTLDGPALPETAKPASTLGDPAELAEQAKKPWWRRPFG